MRLFVLALLAGLMLAPTTLADEVKAIPNIEFNSPYHLFHPNKIQNFMAWTGNDGTILLTFDFKGDPWRALNRLLIVLYDEAGNYLESFSSHKVYTWWPNYNLKLTDQGVGRDHLQHFEIVYNVNLMVTRNTGIIGLAYYTPLSGR